MGLTMLLPPSLGQLRAEARASVLADWLQERLEIEMRVSVADSYEELASALANEQVDMAWAPPLVCAQVADRVAAIFKAVRSGRASYCSAIVARPGGPESIAALRGKRAAWVDRRSIGGYVLAAAYLRRAGVDPDRDLGASRFHGAYGDALRAVLAGQADFTATFSTAPDELQTRMRLHELIGSSADGLVILGHTEEAPSDGLVVTERARRRNAGLVARLGPLVDGVGEYTLLLSLLEADRLVLADPGDYSALAR